MEKKMKLYAYKIENDKISTSHSDFYDKIVLKLSQTSAIKLRCMTLNESSNEVDLLASYHMDNSKKVLFANIMRIAPTREMPSLPPDFLNREEISYSDLEGLNEDEQKMTCKSSYYIVVNQNHLVTNLPKTSISRFKTYINWLLEAERGDKLYKFSILIESPKGTPLSDINQIVFSGDSSFSLSTTTTTRAAASNFKVWNIAKEKLSSLFKEDDFAFLVDKNVLSANLVIKFNLKTKKQKEDEQIKKALSAVITPIVDEDGVSFKTKDNKPITSGQMIRSKTVMIDVLDNGLVNEQNLMQEMIEYLNELKGINR